ncbi:hypothetical protein GGI25_000987 [Coemansia spiralis]|uniref:Carboxypeptidase n=2 Tax=Coemansia TaxID=4863 RepID=A0A9W8GBD4_9FUNG|nr:hypothetical protein EDC05_002005 [Coemansia umbellata]KAJ2623220.1 hypothetical protein GGI26_002635 [Coemansia sp. RSA 1358]KAJ2680098.1 hypothetical protein GGI25_000987 [Coemansia spiralis]
MAVAWIALVLILGLGHSALGDSFSADSFDEDRVAGLPYRYGEQPLHESYAGHITVRTWTPTEGGAPDSGKAKLFYWYFPAITPKVAEPPLLLWIQGGPGSSSMIGLFTELGPLELTDDGEFYRRNVSWANEYDLLIVDQPAGTGFSSVTPQKNLTLNDLFPLAKRMPADVFKKWEESYSGNVNQYRDIKSPIFAEFAVAEARRALEALLMPSKRWSNSMLHFVDKFEKIVGARDSRALKMDTLLSRINKYEAYMEADRSKDLGALLSFDAEDLYLVNSGYGSENNKKEKSVWEQIGLSANESGDFVDGYVTNMRAVGKDMWTFMQTFYSRRPELRKRDFYIFSESYGGKFVPAIAAYFIQKNEEATSKTSELNINLRGVSIGNSWVHPLLQILVHGTIGFAWGLLDADQADVMDLLAFKALNHAMDGDLDEANIARLLMFDYYKNVTDGVNWYDIRMRNHKYKRTYLDRGLNQQAVRKALHSEDIAYEKDWGVYYHLTKDIMRTSAPLFPYLLEKGIPVQLAQGQFDFRDGAAGNTLWINELEWKDKQSFAQADRQKWWLQKELAGYERSGGLLTHRIVLNAGHMSPGDQPEACLDMVKRFVGSTTNPFSAAPSVTAASSTPPM